MSKEPTLCPVPGCTDHQNPGKLMCLRHWRMVSGPTARAVIGTWNMAKSSKGEAALAAMQRYRLARDAAIHEAAREQALHEGGPLDRLAQATEGLMP